MIQVEASIITIGDELLIGQTIDTNSAFISQELNKMGIWVRRRVAIADDGQAIKQTLAEEAGQSQIIIITGGLGPTADDITKPTLCEYFNTNLVVNEGALKNVTEIFQKLGRPMIERNAKQAEVPESCVVLPNLRGTAPGMWFEKDGVVYISLPGVPHEMKGLMAHSVLPKLKEQFTLPALLHRTLLTAGQGESFIAERLVAFEENLPSHIKLAYLPTYGMVRLRLTGRAENMAVLTEEIDSAFANLQVLVKEWLIAVEDVSVPVIISWLLKEKGATLSTAESCTGGYIAHLLTSLPGSSAIFLGTVVAYDNSVKENVLGVDNRTLQEHGAVSEQTVLQMAAGACKQLQTDYAIATSGIMGPDGGSGEKPVGTVWIGVANKDGRAKAQKFHFRFDRMRNIELAANNALLLLRKFLLEKEV
ncbi:competence/damage-inducible protein A [Flavisolibacter sp. BT320]|nr:competence/damage-inducible protein A [Flavisolibacter longurius]